VTTVLQRERHYGRDLWNFHGNGGTLWRDGHNGTEAGWCRYHGIVVTEENKKEYVDCVVEYRISSASRISLMFYERIQ